VVLAAVLVAALAGSAPAHADGLDQTCELTATRFDADSVNVLFPDESAQYWSARYTAVPGTHIRIDGVYPYARYTSWNVYDPLLRPFTHKADVDIRPDAGSANPFVAGADRTTPVAQRHYTLFITFDAGYSPGPNTIYVAPSKNPAGVFTLRVYVPDNGRDVTGGVGLPQVTWEDNSQTAAPSVASPCTSLQKPSISAVTGAYAAQSSAGDGPPQYPGRNPPSWKKFVNLCFAGQDLFFDNPYGDQLPPGASPCDRFGSGGFLSNMDNAYVYTGISRSYGPIVVFHGKAPTFADTWPPAPVMPSGVQLRYWSFCQNDPFSQRYVDCRRDDQVAKDASGNYTIVVSPPDKWPKRAQKKCPGASWIAWGPQPQGSMILRNMLPDPSFAEAIQKVQRDHEAAGMGAYYPAGAYFKSWRDVAKTYC
jgi:hypothetical protein